MLLHLISKHKIEITDIPIAALLEQYLAYIDEMQLQDMEVSSEFLEMAARLVYIKSAMLLPRHEEAAQLKQELTGELLEYQACKAMAGRLKDFYAGDTIFAGKGVPLPKDMTYRRVHGSEVLAKAYLRCVGRPGPLPNGCHISGGFGAGEKQTGVDRRRRPGHPVFPRTRGAGEKVSAGG